MSDHLQIGQHPDADQLSAFAEQSLTVYEREQTLAHLAECSRCRKIVALSLPPIEEPVLEEAGSSEKPWLGGWFSGWRLAWIAAPSLAAFVVLTVYMQTRATNKQRVSQTAQVAEVHTPGPKPEATVTTKDNPPSAKASPPRETPHPTAFAKTEKPNPSSGPTIPDALPENGRSVVAARQAPIALQPREETISVNGVGSGAGNVAVAGTIPGVAATPAPPASGSASQVVAAAAPVMQAAPASQTAPANLPMTKPLVAAASSPAPGYAPPAAPNRFSPAGIMGRPGGSLGQVHSFAGVSAARKSTFTAMPAPLPSGQPILSFAANARQWIAIDTQNHLFLSEDDGHHWKQVTPVWQGRAVAVTTTLSPSAAAKVLSFVSPERFTSDMRASAELSTQTDSPNSSLSGLVTDSTGAVVANATIVVKENRYGVVRTEKTDAKGHYLFANLAPGTYRIDAQAMGFSSQSLVENLKPEQAVRNITLSVGATAETVTVDAASVQLETHSRSEDVAASQAKKVAASPAATARPLIFVITTDSGVRWTSSDGITWQHE